MKRILLTMIFLCARIAAFAQEGVGVFGGVTSSSAKLQDFNIDNVTQFRAGIAYKYPVALGFAVQPEFSYSVKGTDLTYALNNEVELSMFNLHMGFVEAALQLQWGPDLLIFRPYALVEPFVGYAFNDRIQTKAVGGTSITRNNVWDCIQRLEYGYAWGGGLDLFGFMQVSAKHYVNCGSLYKAPEHGRPETVDEFVMSAFKDNKNFQGWVISLAFFF